MGLKNINILPNTPEKITYLNLIKILNLTNSQLYTILGDIFDNPQIDKIFTVISHTNLRFRICVDEDSNLLSFKELIKKNKDRFEFFCIKFDKFDKKVKEFTDFFEECGIDYYYSCEIDENNYDLLNKRVYDLLPSLGKPNWFHLSVKKNEQVSEEQYKKYFDLLQNLEKELEFVITDKDSYFLKEPQFDCEHYSEESLTIMADGSVILCPTFSNINLFKKSSNQIGNIFDIGINRIFNRSIQVKRLNTIVSRKIKPGGLKRECDICVNYMKK